MASTSVVLPWSTWAMMATLRMSSRVSRGIGTIFSSREGCSGPCGQPRPQRIDHRSIADQPRHVVQLVDGQPPQLVVVLQGLWLPQRDRPPQREAVAGDAQGPPTLGQRPRDRLAVAYADTQLLAQLTVERVDRQLAALDLATGELPAARQGRGGGPSGRHQPGRAVQVVHEGSRHHQLVVLGHRPSLEPSARGGLRSRFCIDRCHSLPSAAIGAYVERHCDPPPGLRRSTALRGGRMTIRKVAAIAGTAALALVLTSCAESSRDDDTGNGNGNGNGNADNADSTDTGGGDAAASDATFIFGAAGEPTTFDPFYASDGETFRVTRQIYQNLIGIQEGGTEAVPELATEWSSEDGLTWTFKLQ